MALVTAVLCAATLSFGTLSVYAEESMTSSDQSPDSSVSSDEQAEPTTSDGTEHSTARERLRQEVEKFRAEAKDAKQRVKTVKDRLAGHRLKACENHQATIRRILTRAEQRGANHVKLFATITTRVEDFYMRKGHVLATYDQLVGEVAAKKTAAETAINAVKAAGTDFTCMSDNPKAQVQAARAEVKAEIAALKSYRAAVKNLIVGVKSVQDTSENGS